MPGRGASALAPWHASIGALLGLGLSGLLLHALPLQAHWLIAPLGASIVILFIQPHSPVAQPWPVIGSYLIGTVLGLMAATLIADPRIAAALGIAASVWFMMRLNCVHPPGGALVVLIVLDGPPSWAGMAQTAVLVGANVTVMLAAAMLVSNLVLRRRYPFRPEPPAENPHRTLDALPLSRTSLTHADLAGAVKQLNTFVDVQEGELVTLYNLAIDNAFERHLGLSCGDIMSHDVVKVSVDTTLDAAWNALRAHKIKALPVVDRSDRLVGVLTVADYLRQMDDSTVAGLTRRLSDLLQRTPAPDPAGTVAQIMSTHVHCARVNTPITELVHRMTEQSLPHIPVVDARHQVIGIVTQTDLLAALYKRIALSAS